MFVDVIIAVMSLAFPDVCKIITPAGPVPIPLLNLMFSSTRLPMVFNVIIGGGFSLNLFGTAVVSSGNEAGIAMGVVSGVIVGPGRAILGSFKVFFACAPATRMTSPTMQNGMPPNSAGITLICGQFRVMAVV
ncbi:MAG TPA: DUF4150 domain-containing protein [Burkholderiales bacterium]|nr:DUF4150 domain-containing protein [Burkholderiales bacterium]